MSIAFEIQEVRDRLQELGKIDYEVEIPKVTEQLEKTSVVELQKIYQERLDRYTAESAQIKPLELRLTILTRLESDNNDYRTFHSEYSATKTTIKPLTDNLTDAIKTNDNKSADIYYDALRASIDLIQEKEEEANRLYGMLPSSSVYIEIDELGECQQPKHLINFNPLLTKYKPEYDEGYLSINSKIEIADLYKKYGELLALTDYEPIRTTIKEYERRSWDIIEKMIPDLDNDKRKMKERLGRDGIINFLKRLNGYQHSYATQFRSRINMLEQLEKLYDEFGLRKTKPNLFESERIYKLKKKYTDAEIDLHFMLNLPLTQLMTDDMMRGGSYVY